jgi:hypothetical protein
MMPQRQGQAVSVSVEHPVVFLGRRRRLGLRPESEKSGRVVTLRPDRVLDVIFDGVHDDGAVEEERLGGVHAIETHRHRVPEGAHVISTLHTDVLYLFLPQTNVRN